MSGERERLERLSAQLETLLRDSSAAEPSPSELAALDVDLSSKFPSVCDCICLPLSFLFLLSIYEYLHLCIVNPFF